MKEEHKKFTKKLFAGLKKIQKKKGISDEELEVALNKFETPEGQKVLQQTMKKFGSHLREMRETKGLSIEELSKIAKVPMASIQLLEAGVGDESTTIVFDIAKALGGELEWVPRKSKKKTTPA